MSTLADAEAITDGSNPLTISHAARVSSWKNMGMLNNMIGDPEKGSIWRNITKKTEVKCNMIATMPQPDSHLGMSFDR